MTKSDKKIKKEKSRSVKKIKKVKKKKVKATTSEIPEVKIESNNLKSEEHENVTVKSTENVETELVTNAKGRPYTVSIALPGSILDNAQNPDLRTYLAGQIARNAVINNVDEIVVFDESGTNENIKETGGNFSGIGHSAHDTAKKNKAYCCLQLGRLLQYLECPQYLRKDFFPKHSDLSRAGLMNPLDTPHHMRALDKSKYREGVVVDRPTKSNKGSFVDCGIRVNDIIKKDVQIDLKLDPKTRVTVEMSEESLESDYRTKKFLNGKAVDSEKPRLEDGIYWGYRVRLASSLSEAIIGCPWAKKYDVTVGTSERGNSVDNFQFPVGEPTFKSNFTHLLIVFGGVEGLEKSLRNDDKLSEIDDPSQLFDCYLNTCPNQGSRTIRTEEAILVTMAALRNKLEIKSD